MEEWGALDFLILKILITGGLGLIGGRLGYFLSDQGHNVTLATRANSPNLRKNLSSGRSLNIKTIDWNNIKQIESLCASNELVIHSAGMNAHECSLNPEIAIRTTVIVGYPGESEEDFNELKEWIMETKFDRLGCFAYSHEENTHAYSLVDDVSPKIKQERINSVMEIQSQISLELNQKKINQVLCLLNYINYS